MSPHRTSLTRNVDISKVEKKSLAVRTVGRVASDIQAAGAMFSMPCIVSLSKERKGKREKESRSSLSRRYAWGIVELFELFMVINRIFFFGINFPARRAIMRKGSISMPWVRAYCRETYQSALIRGR